MFVLTLYSEYNYTVPCLSKCACQHFEDVYGIEGMQLIYLMLRFLGSFLCFLKFYMLML